MATKRHILKTATRTAMLKQFDPATDEDTSVETVVEGVSWCGAELHHPDWFFSDAEHAKRSLDGSIGVCRKCWRAAVAAGAVTPPDALQIDTWALAR